MSHPSRLARAARALLAAAALLALAPAARAESPVLGSFDFRLGGYKPSIDDGIAVPAGKQGPYETAFGGGHPLQFRADVAKALPWRDYGTVELGLGVGYWKVTGHGVFATGGATSPDRTALGIVPVQLALTYRLDLLWERLHVPFVPYGRLSLDRYNWWVTDAANKTVKSGATNGWAWGGGLCFVLDVVDSTLARELDYDIGINHTMLFVDYAKNKIDDFGSKKSWDLSDTRASITFGLLFVF